MAVADLPIGTSRRQGSRCLCGPARRGRWTSDETTFVGEDRYGRSSTGFTAHRPDGIEPRPDVRHRPGCTRRNSHGARCGGGRCGGSERCKRPNASVTGSGVDGVRSVASRRLPPVENGLVGQPAGPGSSGSVPWASCSVSGARETRTDPSSDRRRMASSPSRSRTSSGSPTCPMPSGSPRRAERRRTPRST